MVERRELEPDEFEVPWPEEPSESQPKRFIMVDYYGGDTMAPDAGISGWNAKLRLYELAGEKGIKMLKPHAKYL